MTLRERFDEILKTWLPYVENRLSEEIRAEGLTKSESLVNSISSSIIGSQSEALAEAVLTFNEYGWWQASQRLRYDDKLPNLDTLREYIEQYYFDDYLDKRVNYKGKRVRRYRNTFERRGYDAAVQEMMWSLAHFIKNNPKKGKRKLHFFKTMFDPSVKAAIPYLYALTGEQLEEEAWEQIKAALKKQNQERGYQYQLGKENIKINTTLEI